MDENSRSLRIISIPVWLRRHHRQLRSLADSQIEFPLSVSLSLSRRLPKRSRCLGQCFVAPRRQRLGMSAAVCPNNLRLNVVVFLDEFNGYLSLHCDS
jgi:hypothetical protein